MKRILLSLLSVVCVCCGMRAQDIVYLRQDAQSQSLRYQVASVDEDVLVRKAYFREDWPERKWFRDDLRNCLREESGNIYTFDREGHMLSHTYTLRGAKLRATTCTYQAGRLVSLTGEGCKVVRNGNDLDIYAESDTYANPSLEGRKGDYAFDLKCRMEWADDGNLLASRYFYVDSTPAKAYEYEYNHRGQVTQVTAYTYAPHGQLAQKMVTRYTYDNNDHLAKMVVRGNEADDTYIYENNAYGDPVSVTYKTPFGTTTYEYEYRYDESGNWVMRLQWKDGVFENAVLRTIRYHSGGDAAGVAQAEAKAQQKAAKEAQAKAAKEQKAKAEKPAKEQKAKAEKPAKEKKAKAGKPAKEKKAKAEKPAKEQKAKAEKPAKEKKAKAEKPAKEKKAKAEKPAKEKKAKAEKPKKEPRQGKKSGSRQTSNENMPDEIQ